MNYLSQNYLQKKQRKELDQQIEEAEGQLQVVLKKKKRLAMSSLGPPIDIAPEPPSRSSGKKSPRPKSLGSPNLPTRQLKSFGTIETRQRGNTLSGVRFGDGQPDREPVQLPLTESAPQVTVAGRSRDPSGGDETDGNKGRASPPPSKRMVMVKKSKKDKDGGEARCAASSVMQSLSKDAQQEMVVDV